MIKILNLKGRSEITNELIREPWSRSLNHRAEVRPPDTDDTDSANTWNLNTKDAKDAKPTKARAKPSIGFRDLP